MHEYADGTRKSPMMNKLAKKLSAEDIADLAAHYATLKESSPRLPMPGAGSATRGEVRRLLVRRPGTFDLAVRRRPPPDAPLGLLSKPLNTVQLTLI